MAKDEREMIEHIVKYTASKGGAKGNWYIGISKDPEKQLFKVHNVDRKTDMWMFNYCVDTTEGGRIIDKLLMMGYDGEAPHTPDGTGIYIYQKRSHTKE